MLSCSTNKMCLEITMQTDTHSKELALTYNWLMYCFYWYLLSCCCKQPQRIQQLKEMSGLFLVTVKQQKKPYMQWNSPRLNGSIVVGLVTIITHKMLIHNCDFCKMNFHFQTLEFFKYYRITFTDFYETLRDNR